MIIQKLRAYQPSPESFEQFKVEFKIKSGFLYLNHPYMNFDGVVAYQMMRFLLGNDFYSLPNKNVLPVYENLKLPLKHSHNVYHASVGVHDSEIMCVDRIYKRFDEYNTHYVDSKKRKVPKGAGYFKNCSVRVVKFITNTVTCYMHGDIDLISKLMQHVTHLGVNRAKGGGEVESVKITSTEEDYSLIKDNRLMRPVPFPDIIEHGLPNKTMKLTYKFPYWDKRSAVVCGYPGAQLIDFYEEASKL